MPYLSPALNVMVAAARKAGRGLIRDFGELENLQVSRKGPADFVSTADQRTERILLEEFQRARPGYGFLMEEGGHHRRPRQNRTASSSIPSTAPPTSCTAFRSSPFRSRSNARASLHSAVVFNPVTDEMFIAERGHGAYLNDQRLRVAARERLADCVVATGTPFHGTAGHEQFSDELARVMHEVAGVRRFGSAALDLAWVAAGRFDGYWERDISALGHRRGHPAGARGGRRGHRSRRARPHADRRPRHRRERDAAQRRARPRAGAQALASMRGALLAIALLLAGAAAAQPTTLGFGHDAPIARQARRDRLRAGRRSHVGRGAARDRARRRRTEGRACACAGARRDRGLCAVAERPRARLAARGRCAPCAGTERRSGCRHRRAGEKHRRPGGYHHHLDAAALSVSSPAPWLR